MIFKFNWVLINELAISSAPNNDKFLDYIKNEGIKSILTLCSEREVFLLSQMDLHMRDKLKKIKFMEKEYIRMQLVKLMKARLNLEHLKQKLMEKLEVL